MSSQRILSGLCIAGAILLLIQTAGAEEPSPPSFTIEHHQDKIVIDGKLDEPVWQLITPITSFVQTEPDEGKPVSEPTEARIFYDDKNLYLGFKCYDSHPEKILKRLDVHDASTTSDSVDILLDPFHSRNSGYFFSINSMGIQFDATLREANGTVGFQMFDASWDAVWQDATSFDSKGWYLEVAIPFKILRFPRTSPQEWGINLNRWIVRKNENSRWVFVPRFENVMRPSKAGTMAGLENIKPGHALDFIPSVTARTTRLSSKSDGNYEGTGNASLDTRYGLTSNLTLHATVNPDFLQAEADVVDLTLSRFELLVPEKRTFFTDGRDYYQTPLSLFFSRRVGAPLPDNNPQNVLLGTKITGQIGQTKIGFLDAVTKQEAFADLGSSFTAPGANFMVFRVSHDILASSSVGFITVNRDQNDTHLSYSQRVAGFDAGLLLGPHITWNSQFAVSTPAPDTRASWSKQIGAVSEFLYNAEQLEYGLKFKSLGDQFDVSQIGFEPEAGRFGGYAYFTYKPYINRWGIRQLFLTPNYDYAYLQDRRLDSSGADLIFGAQYKNFWESEIGISQDRVRFNLFTPDHQPVPDGSTKVYNNPKIWFTLSSNQSRSARFTAQYYHRFGFVNYPFYFRGKTQDLIFDASLKIGRNIRTSISTSLFRERFSDGQKFQNRGDVIWRLSGNFTRKLSGRLLLQYASQIDPSRFVWDPANTDYSRFVQKRWSVNSLIAYDFNALSSLYVGYNSNSVSLDETSLDGKEVFVKFSYLFSF